MSKVTLLDTIVLDFLADADPIPPPAPEKRNKWDLALGKVLLDLHQLRAKVHSVIADNPKMSEKRKRDLTQAYDTTYFGIATEIVKD